MERVLPLMVTLLFLAGIFFVPVGVPETPARMQETPISNDVNIEHNTDLSWLPSDKSVRVAVYNTTNSTVPSYVSGAFELNNTWVIQALTDAGYSVSEVDLQDIQNHELQSKNYDVLVFADLAPYENITYLVKEFWLGGGGILAFDTAGEYLCYSGILPIESEGNNGVFTYLNYISENVGTVVSRHPATKSYQIGESLINPLANFAMYDLSSFTGLIQENDLTVLVEDDDTPNNIKALALNPSTKGGKVVHIGVPSGGSAPTDYKPMLVDAVEWLCPRPKARVLYDLSHEPYYGIDGWDESYAHSTTNQTLLRNDMVMKGCTVDKLYPSASGNLTTNNLVSYDVLVMTAPYLNFTAQEVADVTNWISSGGSLFVIGEYLAIPRQNLNYLLMNTHMQLNETTGSNSLSSVGTHVVHESAITISCLAPGSIEVTSPAKAVWDDGSGHVVVALESYGAGRIAIADDTAIFRDGRFELDDHQQLATNLMNWLTAGDVLVYADLGGSSDNPNKPNPYKGPIASALMSLEIPFLLTSNLMYFNWSLVLGEWDLVVFDQSSYDIDTPSYWSNILDYLKDDGKIILSSWQMLTDIYPDITPLWDYVGVEYTGNYFTTPPTIYLWDTNPIFSVPYDYGADNITTTYNYVNADCANLTVLSNGTAIAGLGTTQSTTNASIVLGAGGRAITNGMLLSAYHDDTDDSTYADCYELWQNEIAYMMRPEIDSPSDLAVEHGSTGTSITWTPSSDRPASYIIERDLIEIEDAAWDGSSISVPLDGYALGDYVFEVTVYDTAGLSATDSVTVTIEDTTSPVLDSSPANLEYEEGTSNHYLNWSFTELNPDSWVLYVNESVEESGSWDGSEISVDIGGLTESIYNVTIVVNDTSGNFGTDTVYLNVTDTSATIPTTTTPTTTTTEPTGPIVPGLPEGIETQILLIAIIGALILVVIVLAVRRRK